MDRPSKERLDEIRRMAGTTRFGNHRVELLAEIDALQAALDEAWREFTRMENAWRERLGPWPGIKEDRDAWRTYAGKLREALEFYAREDEIRCPEIPPEGAPARAAVALPEPGKEEEGKK